MKSRSIVRGVALAGVLALVLGMLLPALSAIPY